MIPSVQTGPLQQRIQLNAVNVNSLEHLFTQVVYEDNYLAFERIFNGTYKVLCSFASRIVHSNELAEEIVDDVFCNLWRRRKTIQITSSFKSYLMTSIRNRCFDCLRKIKNEKSLILENATGIPSTESIAYEAIVYEELARSIESAIEKLPTQCRTIFMMSRGQDLKYKEIAEILHISVKTVDTQMGRAIKFLRKAVRTEMS